MTIINIQRQHLVFQSTFTSLISICIMSGAKFIVLIVITVVRVLRNVKLNRQQKVGLPTAPVLLNLTQLNILPTVLPDGDRGKSGQAIREEVPAS